MLRRNLPFAVLFATAVAVVSSSTSAIHPIGSIDKARAGAGAETTPTTVLVVLADDVDNQLLPLLELMPNLRAGIQKEGVTFTQSFVTTPVCCPSRASILSGRYQHNTRTVRNSISGGCNSAWWQQNIEMNGTLATHLHGAGWITGYFGKYLNQYGMDDAGIAHIPPGWSEWLGLRGNSVYYDYTLSNNGKAETHGRNFATDYLTDLLANRSAAFLRDTFAARPTANVFAMVGTPAAHSPYDPAPQYAELYPNATAPRTPNWNTARDKKHWLVGNHRDMGPGEIAFSDLSFRRRMMTLRSLDDLLGKLLSTLQFAGRLDNAFVIFTADNGFHSGQFTMPDDKRLPYESDIRVPLLVRAPKHMRKTLGNTSSAVISAIANTTVLNIDLAPTLLDIAGLPPSSDMDGTSFLPHVVAQGRQATRNHARKGAEDESSTSRSSFLVEYHGEFGAGSDGQYAPLKPPLFKTPPYFPGPAGSKMQDCENNTYSCIRSIGTGDTTGFASGNGSIFCHFYANDNDWALDKPYFAEFYNLSADPFQVNNTVGDLAAGKRARLQDRLLQLRGCKGRESCA